MKLFTFTSERGLNGVRLDLISIIVPASSKKTRDPYKSRIEIDGERFYACEETDVLIKRFNELAQFESLQGKRLQVNVVFPEGLKGSALTQFAADFQAASGKTSE